MRREATGLRAELRAAVDAVRAASSAFRPAVAAYLFDAGLAPLHAALGRVGPVDTELVAATWRLMLETVATRRFGVSDDRWRGADDYPDRYYPVLWLDIVPRCLPAIAPSGRLDALAMLFNLGENLPSRAIANAVAARLVADLDRLTADPRAAVAATLDAVGLLAADCDPPTDWRRIERRAAFDCARVDADFAPEDVVAGPGRAFAVVDRRRDVVIHLDASIDGLVYRGRGGAERGAVAADARVDDVVVRLAGRALCWHRGDERRTLGHATATAPSAVAANARGDILIVDAASTHVELWRARR